MLELKFDEQTATAVFESLDKDAERYIPPSFLSWLVITWAMCRKILATDVQGAFATALCLLNISVGDLGKRATLGLNWSKAKATGMLHRRDVLQHLPLLPLLSHGDLISFPGNKVPLLVPLPW